MSRHNERSGIAAGLLTLDEVGTEDLLHLIDRSCAAFTAPERFAGALAGRILGVYFAKTSTRTRTAFTAGAMRLGAQVIQYGPLDLQLNTGESPEDTGRMFGLMLDGLVMRTAGPLTEMRAVARGARFPVVNAMAAEEHPTQGICDVAMIKQHFGQLDGVSVLYVGEGNNTAVALAKAVSALPGMRIELATPPGHGLPDGVLAAAQSRATRNGSQVSEIHSTDEVTVVPDVVYTTRWQTTGTTKPDADWRELFRPFHVDMDLMNRWPRARFMHDLPAHRGEDVSSAVLDGDRSLAWDQARMKHASAIAVLEQIFAAPTEQARQPDTTAATW